MVTRPLGVSPAVVARPCYLADRLEARDGSRSLITVSIDGTRKVGISEIRMRSAGVSWPVWALGDPRTTLQPRLWSVLTDRDVLVDAFLERVNSWLEGRPENSPWCWDEPVKSSIVILADHLAARGYMPSLVVAGNRTRGVYRDGVYRLVVTDHSDARDFLSVPLPDGELRVLRTATFGWLVDRRAGKTWRRLDLGRTLTGSISAIPGLAESAAAVADVGETVLTLIEAPDHMPASDTDTDLNPDPYLRTVQDMRRLGFGDVSAGTENEGGPLRSGTLHLVHWTREAPVSAAALKQHFADSVIAGRRMLFVTDARLARPAQQFAAQGQVLVLNRDPENGAVWTGDTAEQLRFGSEV